jgi:hypothetical protein
MTHIARRTVLTGGAAALAAGAVVCIAEADANGGDLRDLWRRFIEAELQLASACSANDSAEWAARQVVKALACPWSPMDADRFDCSMVEVDRRKELTLAPRDVTSQQGGVGPWLVREYRPLARPCTHK